MTECEAHVLAEQQAGRGGRDRAGPGIERQLGRQAGVKEEKESVKGTGGVMGRIGRRGGKFEEWKLRLHADHAEGIEAYKVQSALVVRLGQ